MPTRTLYVHIFVCMLVHLCTCLCICVRVGILQARVCRGGRTESVLTYLMAYGFKHYILSHDLFFIEMSMASESILDETGTTHLGILNQVPFSHSASAFPPVNTVVVIYAVREGKRAEKAQHRGCDGLNEK